MEPLFEHRKQFSGVETRVLELEGRGDPVVLFHGWSDSADTWRYVLALLAREGRRAIAVDLPGFGTAELPGDGLLLPQLDAFGAAVLRYALTVPHRPRARGAERGPGPRRGAHATRPCAVVVGNSLGGCLALRLAQRTGATQSSAERIARVVALAPAGLDMAGWFRLIEHDPLLRPLLALPVPLPRRAMREVVGRVYQSLAFAHPEAIDPGVTRAFSRHHADREAVARLLASGRRLIPELRDPYALETIAAPVLLIWGDRDRMVYASGAGRVLAEVPDARLELLHECGHCPQVERPERVVELVLQGARQAAHAA
ncbi:MAG TPA: alpha/beta fold hydrolase [Conexibacter sp.]|jgi:pimeloyl-ACP methyl ester carboxylesterase